MPGWDDIDSLPQTDIREVNQKRDDIARLCLRVFSTEDGGKLLDWLTEIYVDVPVAVPGADPSHAFFAEGQRNVVRDLKARVKQARTL
jgi:hypothetical protein